MRKQARRIFGPNEAAILRWVDYWAESRKRNLELLSRFEEIVPLEISKDRVLDVGCGTGGLGLILRERGGRYTGVDYHRHVLRFAEPGPECHHLQSDGTLLPFVSGSFRHIFAFDVIEHLAGGPAAQQRFLRELRRVLHPLGMIFLTTPNFWYPYDAHSDLYFPQYLPGSLSDAYIRWKNPAFLEEHRSFGNIHLLRPRFFKKALSSAQLASLHDLPCCLDRPDYRQEHPVIGWIPYLGLGWYLHAEFWTILVHSSQKERLRLKLRKSWYYKHSQPESNLLQEFESGVDFDRDGYGHQLGNGWYWHERDSRGFRWTGARALAYLESRSSVRYLQVEGYSPGPNRLQVRVDGWLVGEFGFSEAQYFKPRCLLPFTETGQQIFEIELRCESVKKPPEDSRQLGLMIFGIELLA